MSAINQKRIAKNTLLLYVRMGLIMLISFYTSRVVLDVLGEIDNGLYGAVGGIVIAFSFLNGVLSSACNRYFAVEIGRNDFTALRKVFNLNLTVFIAMCIPLLILSESIGLWFLNHKMVFPADRATAVNWVYQCSIISFLISIVSIPYRAMITAKEKMKVYAYCSIIEAILRLCIAFILTMTSFDKLIIYAILMTVVSIITNGFYFYYCSHYYEECRYKKCWDKNLFSEILQFNGWNVIGAIGNIGKNQGVNILLNMFFGPSVNAARSVSYQVYINVNQFVSNFSQAFNPQIIKSYASGERESFVKLVFQSSKFSYYLLYILALPLFLEMPTILDFWLVKVPNHSISFSRLLLILALVDSLHGPIYTSIQAAGKIKWYQILVGTSHIMIIPTSYVLLKSQLISPEMVFIITILYSFLSQLIRIILVNRIIGISIAEYVRKVIIPVLAITLISPIIPLFFYIKIDYYLTRLAVTLLSSTTIVALLIFLIGLTSSEKATLFYYIKKNFNIQYDRKKHS